MAVDPAREPPTLVETSPAIGSSDVPRNVRVDWGSAKRWTGVGGDGDGDAAGKRRHAGAGDADAGRAAGRVLRLTPSGPLAATTFYSYSVTGVRDLQGTTVSSVNGSPLTGTTSDAAAPTVVAVSPPAGPAAWASTPISACGSAKRINPLSVTAQTVTISDGSGQVMASTITFATATGRWRSAAPGAGQQPDGAGGDQRRGRPGRQRGGAADDELHDGGRAGPGGAGGRGGESLQRRDRRAGERGRSQMELSEPLDPATVTPAPSPSQDNVTGQIVVGTVALVGRPRDDLRSCLGRSRWGAATR